MNNHLYGINVWLKKQAEIEGYELPAEDDENFATALSEFGAKYRLPQSIAVRLCDENGELLFDPFNVDDLNAIAKLDNQILIDFNNGLGDPKNSPTADASS